MADILQFPGLPEKNPNPLAKAAAAANAAAMPVQGRTDMFSDAAKGMSELNVEPGTKEAAPEEPESMYIQMQNPDGSLGDKIPMSKAQHKAMQLVMQGMTFVFVGLKPTPSGADFFTAVHGDPTDLRNAADEIPNIIMRSLAKEGIV